MSDAAYLELLKDTTFRPVFILGDHRSGTTLLYKLLADTNCFNVVTAYHVIKYDEVLQNHVEGRTVSARERLADLFVQLGLKNRIFDGVPVTVDLPEEYGFVLTPASRAFLTPERTPRLIELCKKIQFTGDPARPILLKNPWDVLCFRYLKDAFPESKFIFIHRHPVSIINSQLRSIRSLLASRNPYVGLIARWYAKLFEQPLQLSMMRLLFSSRGRVGEKIVARHVRLVTDYLLSNMGAIPSSDYISIKYEELCANPDGTMAAVLDFTGVKPTSPVSFHDRIEPRAPELLAEATAAFESMRGKIETYLTQHGYDSRSASAYS